MVEHNDAAREFHELLPFYVNGTLDAADTAFIESYLTKHPEAASELRFAQLLDRTVKKQMPGTAADEGLQAILDKWHASLKQETPSAWLRLCDHLRSWGMLSPGFAVTCALLVVQSFLIWPIMSAHDRTPTPSLTRDVGVVAAPAQLKVIIRSNARFADLQSLLLECGCRIVAGPSATGELWLAVDTSHEAQALTALRDQLRQSPLVLEASLP